MIMIMIIIIIIIIINNNNNNNNNNNTNNTENNNNLCRVAFTLRRDRILEPVASILPELYNFTYSSYADHPIIHFGEHTITSDEGVNQGDPLGPLELFLTLHPL